MYTKWNNQITAARVMMVAMILVAVVVNDSMAVAMTTLVTHYSQVDTAQDT